MATSAGQDDVDSTALAAHEEGDLSKNVLELLAKKESEDGGVGIDGGADAKPSAAECILNSSTESANKKKKKNKNKKKKRNNQAAGADSMTSQVGGQQKDADADEETVPEAEEKTVPAAEEETVPEAEEETVPEAEEETVPEVEEEAVPEAEEETVPEAEEEIVPEAEEVVLTKPSVKFIFQSDGNNQIGDPSQSLDHFTESESALADELNMNSKSGSNEENNFVHPQSIEQASEENESGENPMLAGLDEEVVRPGNTSNVVYDSFTNCYWDGKVSFMVNNESLLHPAEEIEQSAPEIVEQKGLDAVSSASESAIPDIAENLSFSNCHLDVDGQAFKELDAALQSNAEHLERDDVYNNNHLRSDSQDFETRWQEECYLSKDSDSSLKIPNVPNPSFDNVTDSQTEELQTGLGKQASDFMNDRIAWKERFPNFANSALSAVDGILETASSKVQALVGREDEIVEEFVEDDFDLGYGFVRKDIESKASDSMNNLFEVEGDLEYTGRYEHANLPDTLGEAVADEVETRGSKGFIVAEGPVGSAEGDSNTFITTESENLQQPEATSDKPEEDFKTTSDSGENKPQGIEVFYDAKSTFQTTQLVVEETIDASFNKKVEYHETEIQKVALSASKQFVKIPSRRQSETGLLDSNSTGKSSPLFQGSTVSDAAAGETGRLPNVGTSSSDELFGAEGGPEFKPPKTSSVPSWVKTSGGYKNPDSEGVDWSKHEIVADKKAAAENLDAIEPVPVPYEDVREEYEQKHSKGQKRSLIKRVAPCLFPNPSTASLARSSEGNIGSKSHETDGFRRGSLPRNLNGEPDDSGEEKPDGRTGSNALDRIKQWKANTIRRFSRGPR